MSESMHISADVINNTPYLEGDISGQLNEAVANHDSKITFDFKSDGNLIYSRTYIIRQVRTADNKLSSFKLVESSWFSRLISDFYFSVESGYRSGLNRILPVIINDPGISNPCLTAEKEYDISQLKMKVSDEDYLNKEPGFKRPLLQLSTSATISVIKNEHERLTKDVLVARFGYRYTENSEEVKINAVTSMKMVNKLIKSKKPLVAVDVDQVLVKLSVKAAQAGEQDAEAATEDGIRQTFDKLKRDYPQAQFIAVSSGRNTTAKLEKIGMRGFFNEVIDSDNSEYTSHARKGKKIVHYLKKSGFEPEEVVMIDDQLSNHHQVYQACAVKYKVTNIQYLGALDNLMEYQNVSDQRKYENARDDNSKLYYGDEMRIGINSQEQHFDRNLVWKMESVTVERDLGHALQIEKQRLFESGLNHNGIKGAA